MSKYKRTKIVIIIFYLSCIGFSCTPISIALKFNDIERWERKKNIDELLKITQEPCVRYEAIYALARIGDNRAVDPLIKMLSDENVFVRGAATFALGELGNKRAVEPLIDMLNDNSQIIRGQASQALGKIGDKGATNSLIKMLYDKRWPVYKLAADSLEMLGWKPKNEREKEQYLLASWQWDEANKSNLNISSIIEIIEHLIDYSYDFQKAYKKKMTQISCECKGVDLYYLREFIWPKSAMLLDYEYWYEKAIEKVMGMEGTVLEQLITMLSFKDIFIRENFSVKWWKTQKITPDDLKTLGISRTYVHAVNDLISLEDNLKIIGRSKTYDLIREGTIKIELTPSRYQKNRLNRIDGYLSLFK